MNWEDELKTLLDKYDTEDIPELHTFIESLLKTQRENDLDKIIKGLTLFTEEPIGDIEGDICDWNRPSVFAYNYTPEELQCKVVSRIKSIFQMPIILGKKGLS